MPDSFVSPKAIQVGFRCAFYNLRVAVRRFTRHYEAALKELGLKATQFTLLIILMEREPVPLSRVAEELDMDRTTLSRNLKPLEKNGWISIAQHKDDARMKVLSLTDDGQKILDQALPLWVQAQEQMRQEIGDELWLQMLQSLQGLNWGGCRTPDEFYRIMKHEKFNPKTRSIT